MIMAFPYRAPLPFVQAVESNAARALLPTDFRTFLLRQIAPDLRRRAVFSATSTSAEFAQEIQEGVAEALTGEGSRAQRKLNLQKLVQRMSGRVLGEDDDLRDLTSDRRLNLIVDTQLGMMQGAGQRIQGNTDTARDLYPALELVRVSGAREPRDWNDRWEQAGGKRTSAWPRMIALKDDPVWDNLGNSQLFDDGLDNNFAPFAFGSGMDTIPVPRAEAMALELLGLADQVAPAEIDFNATLQSSAASTAALQEAMIEDLASKGIAARVIDGVLRYIGGATA